MSTRRKLGSKQAYRVITPTHIRGIAVFAVCLAVRLLAEMSPDLREAVAY